MAERFEFYDLVLKHCREPVRGGFDAATETYCFTVRLPRISRAEAKTLEIQDFSIAAEALKNLFFNKNRLHEASVSEKGLLLKTPDLVLMPGVWHADAEGHVASASGKTKHLLVYKKQAAELAEGVMRLLAKLSK